MFEEVKIGFDSVAKPFTHGYTFFHVHLRKFLLYLSLVRIKLKVFFKNTPQRLSRDSQQITASPKWLFRAPSDQILYSRGGQLAARGPHVTHRSVFSGPRTHSEKIFKSKIFSNLVLRLTCQRLPYISISRYGPPLNAAFQKWPPSKINCSPLPYSINVSLRPSIYRPTRISSSQIFSIEILHNSIVSTLLNPVKNSAFWWSMTTLKLSPKTCLHYILFVNC